MIDLHKRRYCPFCGTKVVHEHREVEPWYNRVIFFILTFGKHLSQKELSCPLCNKVNYIAFTALPFGEVMYTKSGRKDEKARENTVFSRDYDNWHADLY